MIPTFASDSGSDQATTKSAIAAGTLAITDEANQTQDVASLSRDTSTLNGTVSKLPDVNALLSDQADLMSATPAAAQVVAQTVGAYAQMKKDQADVAAGAALKAGDADTYNAAMAESKSWAEGGRDRVALHIAGGALIGGLGGGGFSTALQGTAGAGLAAKTAGELDQLSKGVGSATGSELLGNIAANVVAGVGGALVGGTTGATTASNVELYNQSMHRKNDLLSKVCSGASPCGDSLVMTVINAQGANADASAGTLQPNYATVGAGTLSGAVGSAINLYDGTVYTSYSVTQAFPAASWAPGATATLGWIWGARDASSTNAFMNGDGNQFYLSIPFGRINLMGTVTHAYGGSTAIELGITSPGGITAGVVPWSHSTRLDGK